RIGLLLNAAAIAREQLGDQDRAVEVYERVLGWQPDHGAAAHELEELYRVRGQWQPLAALLVDLAAQEQGIRERVSALEMAADIYETKLDDPGAAFLIWLAVLRREPDRTGLVEELERLGPAADAWDELVPACEELAAELEEEQPAAAARLWAQIGRWHRDPLGAPAAAAAALERAARLDPDDVEVLSALLELRRAAGDPEGLAAALALRAAAEIDPFARAALIAEAARLEEEELARPDQAIASYRAALDDDPTCAPAASGLRRRLRDREEWQVLADLLRRLTDEPPAGATPRERAALHHELGEVLGEHLGRPDEAVRAFEAALELEPRDAAAYHGLKQVYRA